MILQLLLRHWPPTRLLRSPRVLEMYLLSPLGQTQLKVLLPSQLPPIAPSATRMLPFLGALRTRQTGKGKTRPTQLSTGRSYRQILPVLKCTHGQRLTSA